MLHALWRSKVVQFDATVTKEHEKAFWFDHAQLTIPRNALVITHNTSVQIAFEGDKRVSVPVENMLTITPYNELHDWVNISWTGLSSNGGGNGKIASTILGNTLFRGKTVIFDRGKEEDKSNIRGRIGFADASACCRASSGKEIDILLSVDSISKGANQSQGGDTNSIQTLLLILIVFSGIGFISTLAVFIINYRHGRAKKLVQEEGVEKLKAPGIGLNLQKLI